MAESKFKINDKVRINAGNPDYSVDGIIGSAYNDPHQTGEFYYDVWVIDDYENQGLYKFIPERLITKIE